MLNDFAAMKCQKVEETFGPQLEYEPIEVEHILAEPETDKFSVDDILCFGKEDTRKSSVLEEIFHGFDYGFTGKCGGLESNNICGGEYDSKLEVLDGLLDEVDDVRAADDLSTVCEDFLLDMDFAQEIYELDCSLHEELFLGNSSSESHSPGLGGTSNSAVGISESSMEIIPDYKWKNDPHNERIGCGVHHTRSKCECQAPTEDSLDLISKNMQNLDELDDDEKPLVSFLLSTKNEKNSGRTAKCSTHLEQKRMRRPTRRYIEEFSGLKTRQTMNGEVLTIASDDNHLKELESDDVITSSESEDCCLTVKRSNKGGDRRKHQRMWTLAEVMKLIDGISQYGVGKWTDIKKLMFSSSVYRTPIDLRDKWRNLLRASCVHKHNQKHNHIEVEEKVKHAVCPLPKHVIHRIHELAAIHPYPRKRISKFSYTSQVTSPTLPLIPKGYPLSLHGRNVRRKNL